MDLESPSAHLARKADVGRLVLFHFSDRYDESEWQAMREDARRIFARTDV